MELNWVREVSPTWDAEKQRVIGGAPEGAFVIPFQDGDQLPGEWWAVRDGADVVAYGRLDTTWGGDAEILLAVLPGRQGQGIGTFALGRLEQEAADRGINYVNNRIREHAERDLVHDWLVVRGFRGPIDGDLRKRVRNGETASAPRTRAAATPSEVYDAAADPAGKGPGNEDQGGYVNIEEHRY